MQCSCTSNVCYGIVRDEKVRRLTFSRNLAEFIQSKNPDHQIWKLDLVIEGPASATDNDCLFGIIRKKNGRLLRAAVSFDEAEYLADDDTRSVVKCKVRGRELHQ